MIEDFDRSLRLDPDQRVGANEEAIEEFSTILEIDPNDIGALFARAVERSQFAGAPSLLTTSGVTAGRPSAYSSTKLTFAKSGAPRM